MSEQKPDSNNDNLPVDDDLELALAAFGDDLRDLLDEDEEEIMPAASEATVSLPNEPQDPFERLLERYGDRLNDDSNLAFAGSIALACSQAAESATQNEARHIVFTVGKQRFALPLTSIVEVAHEANVTPLPKTEAWLKGILILRGNIVSVTDFARLFDLSAGHVADKKVVVLRSQKLEATTALLVDRILGIRSIDSESIQPADSPETHELAAGLATVENSPVTLVDPDQLIGGPRLSTYMN